MSDLVTLGDGQEWPPRRRKGKAATAEALKVAAEKLADRFDESTKLLDEPAPDADHSDPSDPDNMSDIDRAFLTGEPMRKTFGVW